MKTLILLIVLSFPVIAMATECDSWDAAWIWCDEFNDADHTTNYGITNGTGVSRSSDVAREGTYSIKFQYTESVTSSGDFWRLFGTNPLGTQSDNGTDFDEIYWRFYMYLEEGWTGNPYKLTRVTVFVDNDPWGIQAMVSHLWGQTAGDGLRIDPTSCTTGSSVDCTTYNDTGSMTWLGAVEDGPNIYTDNVGEWICIENRVKLNTPGSSDGVHQVWINDVLEIEATGLNYRDSYTDYGLNGISIEGWWNDGAVATQAKYVDNFIISTEKIGLIGSSTPTNTVSGTVSIQ